MNNPKVSSFPEFNSEYRSCFRPLTRERISYTRYQLDLLNGIYDQIPFPNSKQKGLIAKRVGITTEQVKVWFQNRRRKEVILKEKSNHDKKASKDSGKTTLTTLSSTPSSLIPSIILVSIVGELKHFTEVKGKKAKLKRKPEYASNQPLGSCQSSPTDNQTLLKLENTKSISEKHSIYFSVFDIKSPPNQITPTVAFNLRSDLYRGPLEAFSAEKCNHPNSLAIMKIHKRDAFQISSGNEDGTFENVSLSNVGAPYVPPQIKVQSFSHFSSIMRSSSYCATDLVSYNESSQLPFSTHCIFRDPLHQISTGNTKETHLKRLAISS